MSGWTHCRLGLPTSRQHQAIRGRLAYVNAQLYHLELERLRNTGNFNFRDSPNKVLWLIVVG